MNNMAEMGWITAEERAAMKEHAQELKTAARRGSRASCRPMAEPAPPFR